MCYFENLLRLSSNRAKAPAEADWEWGRETPGERGRGYARGREAGEAPRGGEQGDARGGEAGEALTECGMGSPPQRAVGEALR